MTNGKTRAVASVVSLLGAAHRQRGRPRGVRAARASASNPVLPASSIDRANKYTRERLALPMNRSSPRGRRRAGEWKSVTRVAGYWAANSVFHVRKKDEKRKKVEQGERRGGRKASRTLLTVSLALAPAHAPRCTSPHHGSGAPARAASSTGNAPGKAGRFCEAVARRKACRAIRGRRGRDVEGRKPGDGWRERGRAGKKTEGESNEDRRSAAGTRERVNNERIERIVETEHPTGVDPLLRKPARALRSARCRNIRKNLLSKFTSNLGKFGFYLPKWSNSG
ncbi:hypothetical protein FB451DRAFT_1170494 [Mycena latifolia]|nr:hypothetical protein FB451DRAFT_1170494 [Mycena latifolia]